MDQKIWHVRKNGTVAQCGASIECEPAFADFDDARFAVEFYTPENGGELPCGLCMGESAEAVKWLDLKEWDFVKAPLFPSVPVPVPVPVALDIEALDQAVVMPGLFDIRKAGTILTHAEVPNGAILTFTGISGQMMQEIARRFEDWLVYGDHRVIRLPAGVEVESLTAEQLAAMGVPKVVETIGDPIDTDFWSRDYGELNENEVRGGYATLLAELAGIRRHDAVDVKIQNDFRIEKTVREFSRYDRAAEQSLVEERYWYNDAARYDAVQARRWRRDCSSPEVAMAWDPTAMAWDPTAPGGTGVSSPAVGGVATGGYGLAERAAMTSGFTGRFKPGKYTSDQGTMFIDAFVPADDDHPQRYEFHFAGGAKRKVTEAELNELRPVPFA